MQNQDGSRDPPGGRNMSQPTAVHHRRGSGSTSASSVAASGSSVNPKEDHQTPPQPGSSSPGPQQHSSSTPPQSHAVMKKKSGFQITSVTPAQMSTNNSIADDTESYDDMDESHTEDLSSSDMLEVSVSRATDTGLPERSSSDETLNSLQSVETPGLVSPNEPLHPHSLPAVSLHQQLVNGEAQLPSCVQSVEAVVPVPGQARGPPSPAPPPPASLADTPHNTSLAQANPAAVSNTLLSSGPLGLDSTVQGLSTGGGPGGPTGVPTTQTQSNPGSRFRVVKLDSSSEPYRKGRWMCTEYYEKEVPPADAKPGEALPTEREPAGVAASAPQTLQSYQQHTQDFTSPQATQNLPALVQSPPLTHTGPVDPGTNLVQSGQPSLASSLPSAPQVVTQASSGVVQHLAYAVDAQPACGGYPAQLSTGPLAMAGGRQPDFIQPTAPFQAQAQAQAPLASAPTGASLVGLSGASQPLQGHAPSTQPAFVPAQPSSSPRAPAHSATYLPLTSLQADLQPLLTHGLALSQAHSGAAHLGSMPSLTASQLQDAQRLLFQHQGLAGLPRLGVTGGGEPGAEASSAGVQGRGEAGSDGRAAGGLAYMGDAVSALRSQPADEEEDSSSGASVVAIDNKIEQAMDLVKSHLMYAVREEVEVLKEQIKELVERNSQLEQENSLLKALASPEQMAQFQAQVDPESHTDSTQAIAPSQPSSTSA